MPNVLPAPFIKAIDAGIAQALSHPSIAVNINIIKLPKLTKLNNQVNKPNKMANPITNSIHTIIRCINIATSGVGSINSINHSNQPGILLKIGVAHSLTSLAALVAALVAPLASVCSQSNGIFTVELLNQESSPRPLNNIDKDEKLSVAFSQVSAPQIFSNASMSQNPPRKSRNGILQSTFPYLEGKSLNIFRLSFVWKNSFFKYSTI